jgi:hypothetical protein
LTTRVGAVEQAVATNSQEDATWRAAAGEAFQAVADQADRNADLIGWTLGDPSGDPPPDWIAAAYPSGSVVTHLGGVWMTRQGAEASHEPGAAARWEAVDVANLADRLNNTRNAVDGLHTEVGDPHVVSPSESLSTFVSHLDGRVSALEHTVTPPTPQLRLLVDNYGGGFVRASAGAVTATPVPVDFALATTPGPNGAVYPNLAAVPAGAAVWADFNGTLGKVKTSSGVDVMSDALKTWITKAAIVTVAQDDSDAAHPVLVVSEVVLPTGSGSSLPLDALADVTAPADTPTGKVLGTTATGAWGPVDPPSGGDPRAAEVAAATLGSATLPPEWSAISWQAGSLVTYQGHVYRATQLAPGGHVPGASTRWEQFDLPAVWDKPAEAPALDGLTDVTAPADTPVGKVLGTTGVGAWGPMWLTMDSLSDVDGTLLAAPGKLLGKTDSGLWGPVDPPQGGGGPVALDDLTDVTVAGAATGVVLTKMPTGWVGRAVTLALDGLSNVTAASDTPVGKVLGTTAAGQWAPVDVPLDSLSDVNVAGAQSLQVLTKMPTGWVGRDITGYWKSWHGTQAEYDAITTKDAATLYVVTP